MTSRSGGRIVNGNVQLDRDALAAFCRKWRIRELSIFGSVLRDDFGPDSDLDFLVSFNPKAGWDLWDLVTMREDLISIVNRDVDIVVKEALRNPYRRKEILTHREIIHANNNWMGNKNNIILPM
jgi:predicted nucleotidyltransferase